MYRRIELITEIDADANNSDAAPQPSTLPQQSEPRAWKTGLTGFGNEHIWEAWSALNSPRRDLNKNCRFFFTEAGWRRYGRPAIIACQQTGQRYRVIRVKEASVDVFYRDEFQVAVRQRQHRRLSRRRHQ